MKDSLSSRRPHRDVEGLSGGRIVTHVLRNVASPIVTMIGPTWARICPASIVETVFGGQHRSSRWIR
jgi:ABC-type dipeptide/oligopeptide/nickel transport system permease component